jgi:hypothetical protein
MSSALIRRFLPGAGGVVQRDGRNGGLVWRRLGSAHRNSDEFLTREHAMMKFYSLIAAIGVFVPVAFAMANQAAMIVA